jgi:hypothetical protein
MVEASRHQEKPLLVAPPLTQGRDEAVFEDFCHAGCDTMYLLTFVCKMVCLSLGYTLALNTEVADLPETLCQYCGEYTRC